jgi:hypothetical protein
MALSPGTVVRKRLRGLRFKPGTFIWHPSYPVIPRGVSRDGVRQQLAIGNRSYLFALLGMLRSNYLTAADLVVLPFHNYLHSGSMIHAISNQRPSWRATKVINGIPTRTISLRRMDTRAATAIRI